MLAPTFRFSSMLSAPKTLRPSGTSENPCRAICSGGTPVTSAPSIVMDPEMGGTTPAMAFSKVDFPAPLGPVTNRTSPASILKLMPRKAVRRP
jgi:hypothetical protein